MRWQMETCNHAPAVPDRLGHVSTIDNSVGFNYTFLLRGFCFGLWRVNTSLAGVLRRTEECRLTLSSTPTGAL